MNKPALWFPEHPTMPTATSVLSQGTAVKPCPAAGHNVVVKHSLPLLLSSEEGSLKNSAEQLRINMWPAAPGEDNSRTCWELNVLQTWIVRALP